MKGAMTAKGAGMQGKGGLMERGVLDTLLGVGDLMKPGVAASIMADGGERTSAAVPIRQMTMADVPEQERETIMMEHAVAEVEPLVMRGVAWMKGAGKCDAPTARGLIELKGMGKIDKGTVLNLMKGGGKNILEIISLSHTRRDLIL